MYASGRTTGMVVDLGHQQTSIGVIYEGTERSNPNNANNATLLLLTPPSQGYMLPHINDTQYSGCGSLNNQSAQRPEEAAGPGHVV